MRHSLSNGVGKGKTATGVEGKQTDREPALAMFESVCIQRSRSGGPAREWGDETYENSPP